MAGFGAKGRGQGTGPRVSAGPATSPSVAVRLTVLRPGDVRGGSPGVAGLNSAQTRRARRGTSTCSPPSGAGGRGQRGQPPPRRPPFPSISLFSSSDLFGLFLFSFLISLLFFFCSASSLVVHSLYPLPLFPPTLPPICITVLHFPRPITLSDRPRGHTFFFPAEACVSASGVT